MSPSLFPCHKGCCQGCAGPLLEAPFPHLSLTLEAVGQAGVQGGWISSRGQHMTGFQPANLEDWREAVTIVEGGAQTLWVHPTLDLPLPGPLNEE